jgi:hypothetical protein
MKFEYITVEFHGIVAAIKSYIPYWSSGSCPDGQKRFNKLVSFVPVSWWLSATPDFLSNPS